MGPVKPGKLHVAVVLLATVIGGIFLSAFAWNVLDSSKLRVGYVKNDANRLPLAYAISTGLFRQAGLDMKFTEFSSESDLLRAMEAGRLDIGFVGIPALVVHELAFDAGIKILAGSSFNGTSLVVRMDAGITTTGDLANKTIAIPATNGTGALLARVLLNGTAAWGTVNLTVADTSTMPHALNISTIDGLVAWDAIATIATYKPEYGGKGYRGTRLHASADAWGNRTTVAVVARGELLANDAWDAIIARFLAVHGQSVVDLGRVDRREAVIDVLKRSFFLNRVDGSAVLDTVKFTTIVSVDHVVDFIDELVAFNMTAAVPDVPDLAAALLA